MIIPIQYNVRSLFVRRMTTGATAMGIALVVFVLASALMLAEGVKRTLGSAGSPDVAIVLRKGSDNELGSGVDDPQIGLIESMPGVKKDGNAPIGSGETIVVTAMEKIGANGITNVQVRGITDDAYKLRPNLKVVEGRRPAPGADEVMVGRKINGRMVGLSMGSKFDIKKNRPVAVVGVFADNGSAQESEVWIDRDVLKQSFGREGSVSSVRVMLDPGPPSLDKEKALATAFEQFKANVESDKRLGLMAMRETAYYEKQSQGLSIFISILGSLVAFFFSLGAMIGATITMFASIANRQREIGTLRALGFSRLAILFSFLIEAIILALLGGIAGSLAALGMGAVKFSMINFASWSEIVFTFDPTPKILATSLLTAVVMGIIGGFLPALRAARVSPLAAMRD